MKVVKIKRDDRQPPPPLDLTPEPPVRSIRILRLRVVEERVGLKKTQIYRMMKRKLFPASVQITEHAVGWLEHEIDAFVLARASARSAAAAVDSAEAPGELGGLNGGPGALRVIGGR